MTATITVLKILRRLQKEQSSKVDRHVRVRLFCWLSSWPWITFNPHAWKRGHIICEQEYGGGMKYTVLFEKKNGLRYSCDYPADTVNILPEAK